MSAGITMLEAALHYATHGAPVFPIWPMRDGACGCGDLACGKSAGKHPIGGYAPNGFKNATTDVTVIRDWWTKIPDANIATPTGGWCVVLDLDPRHQGDVTLAGLERRYGLLPSTAQVVTGGNGRHFYFQPVPGLNCGTAGPGLDVKAIGGYVVVPPSNHQSGQCYADHPEVPLFETALAPMPPWLLELARGGDGWISVERVPFTLADKIPAGMRHLAVFRLTRSLKGKGLSLGAVWAAVEVENKTRCEPPLDFEELHKFFRRAWDQRDQPGFTGSDYAAEEPAADATGDEAGNVASGGAGPDASSLGVDPRPFAEPLGQFLARTFPSPHPIVEGLVSDEGGGFLAGEEKVGKTFWALDEALAIALGQSVGGTFSVPTRRRVLFIEEEDPPRRVHRRLRALLRGRELDPDDGVVQADLDAWFHLVAWQGFTFDAKEMVRRLETELQINRPAVCYVDVLRKVTLRDLNKANEAGALLAELDRLRRAYGVAFRILHHYRKVQGFRSGRGSQEIGGSFVLGAWAENSLFFEPTARQQGAVRVTVQSKDLAPVASFRMQLESDGALHDLWAVRLVVAKEESDAAASQFDESVIQAVGALPVSVPDEGEPGVSISALVVHLKRSRDTVRRALERLVDAGRVKRTGLVRGWTVLYGLTRDEH